MKENSTNTSPDPYWVSLGSANICKHGESITDDVPNKPQLISRAML